MCDGGVPRSRRFLEHLELGRRLTDLPRAAHHHGGRGASLEPAVDLADEVPAR
jgi:hypothetical protein